MNKFGQFRKTQLEEYFTIYSNSQIIEGQEIKKANSTSEIEFTNICVSLQGDAVLQNQSHYYLKFKVARRESTQQKFYLRLKNNDNISESDDEAYTVGEFIAEMGTGDKIFEVIISPNKNYNKILWDLQRISDDYQKAPDQGVSSGRLMNVTDIVLANIKNVVDNILASSGASGTTTYLTKIGIQGPPSLLMCINGEQIRIGRSGIYEINNENITISFVGFVPNQLDYFIMDFEY